MIDIYCLIYDKVKQRKKLFPILTLLILSTILLINGWIFPSANAQTENCYNLESKNALPVLLIHGWNEGEGGEYEIHFDEWEEELNQDMIPFCIISFEQSPDACGSSADHANELSQIIQNIKTETGQNQVNIIGFSKGGLDARVYLANNLANDDVANLIMVGTPNSGSPLALLTNDCYPAILDIRPGAPSTNVRQNMHTQYYTIAGTCLITGDKIVLTSSVNSKPYFKPLGTSNSCHADLLGAYEYGLSYKVLVGGK
jgi:pimeloyl-ACP methyl ester carboxylesterase